MIVQLYQWLFVTVKYGTAGSVQSVLDTFVAKFVLSQDRLGKISTIFKMTNPSGTIRVQMQI